MAKLTLVSLDIFSDTEEMHEIISFITLLLELFVYPLLILSWWELSVWFQHGALNLYVFQISSA